MEYSNYHILLRNKSVFSLSPFLKPPLKRQRVSYKFTMIVLAENPERGQCLGFKSDLYCSIDICVWPFFEIFGLQLKISVDIALDISGPAFRFLAQRSLRSLAKR